MSLFPYLALPHLTQTLEYKDYTPDGLATTGMRHRLATDIVLILLVALYVGLTTLDIVQSIKVRPTQRISYPPRCLHPHTCVAIACSVFPCLHSTHVTLA